MLLENCKNFKIVRNTISVFEAKRNGQKYYSKKNYKNRETISFLFCRVLIVVQIFFLSNNPVESSTMNALEYNHAFSDTVNPRL